MGASSDHRLSRLAAYSARLRTTPEQFVQLVPLEGKGTGDAPYVMGTGHSALSESGDGFVKMAYDTGWVVSEFDWMTWQGTHECRSLLSDRAFIARANEARLARLLTVIIRKDRFAEGTLVDAFESGLMLAIAERAEQLVKEG